MGSPESNVLTQKDLDKGEAVQNQISKINKIVCCETADTLIVSH